MTTIQAELLEATAQAARAAGLLTPQAMEKLLTEALRSRQAAKGEDDPLFGMWHDRQDMAGVDAYIHGICTSRFSP